MSKGALLAALFASVVAAGVAHADRAAPWQRAPFSGTVEEWRRAAGPLAGDGHAAEILFESVDYAFDARGRANRRSYRVYRVNTPAGVDEWGSLRAGWWPWYQDRPRIRARVLSSDGVFHELDPSTVEVGGSAAGSDHMYSDRRTLRAPLPALSPGAIVEYEVVGTDRDEYFVGGDNYLYYFGASVPTREARLRLSAPADLKLRYAVRGLPDIERKRRTSGGQVHYEFRMRALPADSEPEPNLPSDALVYPYVAFSTGRSWAAAARAYADIVDGQIAAGPVDAIDLPPIAGRDRVAIAAEILAFLHQHVRYTGLEFGGNAIVPWTPAETWKRKYGDCKDQATLLVALLRRAGVDARVALLDSGTELDVEPKLPGVGMFDHAIAVLPGDPLIWIDPTAEGARVGQLPLGDQGRRALIADGRTRGLVQTPMSPAEENLRSELRAIELADQGPARVVETTQVGGLVELSYRAHYRQEKPEEVRKYLGEYVEREYLDAELTRYSTTEPADLAKPFELVIEASRAGRAQTYDERAEVYTFPADLTDDLPDALYGEASLADRKHDFAFTPLVRAMRYRIALPAGFEASALPTEETLDVGSAHYTSHYAVEGGAIVAEYRFHSGPGRLAPERAEVTRLAVRAFRERPPVKLVIDMRGARLLAAGRFAEAFAEFHQLASTFPTRAIHQRRLAQALLKVGLGAAARNAARRGVAIEPGSSLAQQTLGWVLMHNELGEPLAAGWDRAGAIAAFTRAKELDPRNSGARSGLAAALARNEYGTQHSGDVAASVVELSALRKDLDDHSRDRALASDLAFTGRFDELRALAESIEVGERLRAPLLLLTALISGGEDGLRRQETLLGLSATERASAYEDASSYALVARRYDEARRLLNEALVGGAPSETQRQLSREMSGLKRFEPADANSPEAVAQAFVAACHGLQDNFESLLSKDAQASAHDLGNWAGLAIAAASVSRRGSPWVELDAMTTTLESHTDVEPWGARVKMSHARFPTGTYLFLVREGGMWKLLGADQELGGVGLRVLRAVARGDLRQARQWLDWVAPSIARQPGFASAFAALWPSRSAKLTAPQARLAAAALLIDSPRAGRAIELLRGCAKVKPAATAACDSVMLMGLMRTRRFEEALAVLDRSPQAPGLRMRALAELGRWEEVTALANAEMEKGGDAERAALFFALAAAARGDVAEAKKRYADSIALGDQARAINEAGWALLFDGGLNDEAMAKLTAAASKTPSDGKLLNTIAVARAQRGELIEARQALLDSRNAGHALAMRPQDWLVQGKIAEVLGDVRLARQAYDRAVEPPPHLPFSVTRLALQWRDALPKTD